MGLNYLKGKTGADSQDVWARGLIAAAVGQLDGKVVIDAGCGSGLDTKNLLVQGALKVLAFDPSEVMLRKARESSSTDQITFEKGTYESIPLGDASADVLVGIFSHHYPCDLDAAYAEIHRVLKKGGKTAFVVTHPAATTLAKKSPLKGQEILSFLIYDALFSGLDGGIFPH